MAKQYAIFGIGNKFFRCTIHTSILNGILDDHWKNNHTFTYRCRTGKQKPMAAFCFGFKVFDQNWDSEAIKAI